MMKRILQILLLAALAFSVLGTSSCKSGQPHYKKKCGCRNGY